MNGVKNKKTIIFNNNNIRRRRRAINFVTFHFACVCALHSQKKFFYPAKQYLFMKILLIPMRVCVCVYLNKIYAWKTYLLRYIKLNMFILFFCGFRLCYLENCWILFFVVTYDFVGRGGAQQRLARLSSIFIQWMSCITNILYCHRVFVLRFFI